MGYITVPTAARRATWRWQTRMTTEPARTELLLHDDARLLAAIGAVISFAGTHCGLSTENQEALTTAAVEACKETFPLVPPGADGERALKLVVADYPDRIEVEIQYDQDQLRLRIRDDGKGIDAKVLEAGGVSGHFGIPGMRERAQRIGARFGFWSELGAGTEVELGIPASMAYQKRRNEHRLRLFHWADGSDERRDEQRS